MSDGRVIIDITGDDTAFRKSLAGLAKAAVAGIAVLGAAVVGLGVAGLRASTEFNAGMANVASLIPGNIGRVNELKTSVQNMALAMGRSTTDMAGGLYNVISAFGDTSDTVKILEINARAAVAGLATTTDAINLTSAVTKAYGDTSARAVEQAADLATMTVRLGQTTFPDLAASIGGVASLSNELGVSQEELFATMATLAGMTGGSAPKAATQYRGALQALLSPTDALEAAIRAAGYTSGRALVEQRGLAGAVQFLAAAAAESGRPLQDFVGSVEGQLAVLAMAGPQAETYAATLLGMADAAGATNEAFAEQTTGINALGFAFQQAKVMGTVALQMIGDAIGNAFGSDAIATFETVREFFDAFKTQVDAGVGPLEALRTAIGETFGPGAVQLFDDIRATITNLAGALSALGRVIVPVAATVGGLAVRIGSSEVAVKLLIGALGTWMGVAVVKWVTATTTAIVVNTVATATNTAATVTNTIARVKSAALTVAIVALYAREAASRGIATAATVAGTVVTWTATGATKALTGAQLLLNLALRANPIGIVIVAVAALVAAIIHLWRTNERFRTGAIAIWAGLVSWVSGIPGRVTAALGDVGTLLAGAGRAIIRGLWDGMRALWREAREWVSGIADWIVRNKGPLARDRKLLEPAGLAIMAGLLKGLKDGWKPVETLLGEYTAALSGDLGVSLGASFAAPQLSPASGLAVGGSSTTITYQIGDVSIPASDQAAQQVFGDLMRLVERYQRMGPMEEM